MEREIVLRSNSCINRDPCSGCIFLKRNPKTNLLDCNTPPNFDYAKYGNCGEKSSCVYRYKDEYKSAIKKAGRKAGAVATKEQIDRDAYTEIIIGSIADGSKTVKDIAIELGDTKRAVYNRIYSYGRRRKITIDIFNGKITKVQNKSDLKTEKI